MSQNICGENILSGKMSNKMACTRFLGKFRHEREVEYWAVVLQYMLQVMFIELWTDNGTFLCWIKVTWSEVLTGYFRTSTRMWMEDLTNME